MISRRHVTDWLTEAGITYTTSGYSTFPVFSRFYFRFDHQENLRFYTIKPTNPSKQKYFKDTEARIRTQCLLWGIEFREPLRA